MSEKDEALALAERLASGRLAIIEQLTDEVEALRRDAERYRWLRNEAYVWGSNEYVRSNMQAEAVAIWLRGSTDMTEPGIDAAIDAAMQKGDKT